MSPETRSVGIVSSDFKNKEVWDGISRAFIDEPGIIQELTFIDGPLMGQGFKMSMHKETDGSGYLQIDHVTNEVLETIFMNYCMDNGEVLPVGIYRFPFDSIQGFAFLKNS